MFSHFPVLRHFYFRTFTWILCPALRAVHLLYKLDIIWFTLFSDAGINRWILSDTCNCVIGTINAKDIQFKNKFSFMLTLLPTLFTHPYHTTPFLIFMAKYSKFRIWTIQNILFNATVSSKHNRMLTYILKVMVLKIHNCLNFLSWVKLSSRFEHLPQPAGYPTQILLQVKFD